MKTIKKNGVTLVELLVVVLIIGILTSIAVTVYTGQVERAKQAAARDMIHQLELAIGRYEVDTGQYPLSGSGIALAPGVIPIWPLSNVREARGGGYMLVSLTKSLNGSVQFPLSRRWAGPYLELDDLRTGDLAGNTIREVLIDPAITVDINGDGQLSTAELQYFDPWGSPFFYVRFDEYPLFNGAVYPAGHPYRTATETFYNPTTFQIISFGRDGVRSDAPTSDDIRNF